MSNRGRTQKPDYIVAQDMGASFNGPWLNIEGNDNLSFQAEWVAPAARPIVIASGDNVVAATKTWNVAAGAFTAADVGGTFTIGGASPNVGTYVVATVVDADTVTSVGAPVGDETFSGAETMSMQDLSPTGVLRVEGSNDGPAVDSSTRQEQPSGQVGASTMTTVASGNPAASASSLVIPLTNRAERWARLCYTATTGGGLLDVAFAGKGI